MKKNILLSIIALVACGSAVAGVASLSTNTVSANGASFYSEGASVKITSSVDDAQVRFNATMTDDFYNSYFTDGIANENVETGMLVVPYDVYVNSGVEELTLETKDFCYATAVDTTTLWTEHATTDGLMESYAVLPTNAIPEQSHNRALLFVAYVTDGTTPVYTAERKTSMSYVAWKAQSVDESVVSATNKQALKDAYMHDYTVTFNDEYARTMTLEYGTYLNDQTSKTLYWDEECTEQVADTDYVSYSAQVYVKDKDVNELLSFDYASDVDTKNRVALTSAGNQQAEWLESYAGESGVMKITYDNTEAKNNWVPQYTITPVVDLTGYSEDYSLHAYATENDYDYVVARMYIVKNESVTSEWTNVRMNGWSYAPSETVVYNEWVDYVFPVSALGAEYGSLTHSFKEQVKICGKDEVFGLGEYYVAGVFLAKSATVTLSGNSVGKAIAVSATDGTNAIDLTNAKISVVNPVGNIEKATGASFTPAMRGDYTVYVEAGEYYGSATVSVSGLVDEKELMYFNSPVDMNNVQTSNGSAYNREYTEIAWLSEYEGEKGVAKFAYIDNGAWGAQFTINTPLQDMSATSNIYEEYAGGYVVVKMYIVAGDGYSTWDYVFSQTTTFNSDALELDVATNQWVEYRFPVETAISSNGSLKFGGKVLDYTVGTTKGEFYVGGVWLEKGKTTLEEATVSVSGTTTINNTLTITATDSLGNSIDLASANIVVTGTAGFLNKSGFKPTKAGTYYVYIRTDTYWGMTTVTVTGE